MLKKFIDEHEILRIGTTLPGYLCTDLIVDDPIGLVNMAFGKEYCIYQINWWVLAPITAGSMLGMGGPRDPRAPQDFFFSELVHLGKSFDSTSGVEDYLSYIAYVKSQYPQADLYPSFDIIIR